MPNSINKNFYCAATPPPRWDEQESEKLIQQFLTNGGKIQYVRDDNGSYDKSLKKTQQNLSGGFNPFSKEEALTINKKDFFKR